MLIEALRCNGCGSIGLSVDDTRITSHKCAGAWTVVAKATFDPPLEAMDDGSRWAMRIAELEAEVEKWKRFAQSQTASLDLALDGRYIDAD